MIKQLTPNIPDYELLDTGEGEKLERFGGYVVRRPEPQAIWRKSLKETEWLKADASFLRDSKSYDFTLEIPTDWGYTETIIDTTERILDYGTESMDRYD